MSNLKPQSFRSHASLDPSYHFALLSMLFLNLVLGIVLLVQHVHSSILLYLWVLIISVASILIAMKARIYPLKIQDRIIRLEERIRLDAVLPDSLRKRIHELTEDQLIGLRFASDDELPTLVELALDKKLDRKQIKERIQNWRPDHFRI